MDLIHPQLAAFAAVLDEGSFEAAARRLSITSSAVSQRIKVLEDRLGQVLVVRQAPCRPTPAGEWLLRCVRPMQALEAEALAEFLPSDGVATVSRPITIAVNDDSLATWFLPALSQLHKEHGYLFDLHVDDQDHTLDFLKNGTALGAVTAESAPLQGCAVSPLGSMRYRAIASPELARQYFGGGINGAAFARAPMIVFNRKDELQWRFVRRITKARINPAIHYMPTPTGIVEAAALGLGWCLAPDSLLDLALQEKRIKVIAQEHWLDVPLYWQCASIRSTTLQNLSQAIKTAAAKALHL